MKIDRDNPKYLAYALGELDSRETAAIEKELADNKELQQVVAEYKKIGSVIEEELKKEETLELTDGQRADIESEIDDLKIIRVNTWHRVRNAGLAVAACAVVMFMVHSSIITDVQSNRMQLLEERGHRLEENIDITDEPADAPVPKTHSAQIVLARKHIKRSMKEGKDEKGAQIACETEEMVQLHYKKPKPMFVGTPKTIKSDNLESPAVATSRGQIFRSKASPNGYDKLGAVTPMELGDCDGYMGERATGGGKIGTHDRIDDNPFESARNKPLSTFSIDVDTASYSMMRQMLSRNALPSPDAVRIEEMINYFDYEYCHPQDDKPFSVNVDVASCPWAESHRLVRIGLKGYEIDNRNRPAANIVFLLDVSGSMTAKNKLGYVKESMKKLLNQLNEEDRVAIVVYAGASGLVLPSTSCRNRKEILAALERLRAGGSTNGGAGLELAYQTAVANFVKKGINRVILCTDGDFNVGVTGAGGLDRLIEEKAKSGVFLTILGYGMGNFRDGSMERLSNKGNGNYAYIDTLNEANKVLVEQIGSTLVTIAKDVKIQVNFNHQRVSSYRLLGYENRMLAAKDFNDDKKDAGEIGAGHTVTALYEVVPKGVNDINVPEVDADKYSPKKAQPEFLGEPSDELLTVKLRYKLPDENRSTKIEVPVVDSGKHLKSASRDFKFSAAVAGFGMILRGSEHKGNASFEMVRDLAVKGKGVDSHGYRNEFIKLIEQAENLTNRYE